MPKEAKTAIELQAIIAERFGVPNERIKVFAAPNVGWSATITTTPTYAFSAQDSLDRIVSKMRQEFDLK